MSLVMKAKAAGGVHIKPGTYNVVCSGVREDEIENSQWDKNVIRFDLQTTDVLDENGDAVELDAIASRKLSPKSKLWGWLTALGVQLDVGADIDLEEAIGHEALAVIEDHTGTDGAVFSRVKDLIPPASQKAVVDVKDLPVSDWWALVKESGFSVIAARDKAVELYKKEPKDLTPALRADVLAVLMGITVEPEDLPFN